MAHIQGVSGSTIYTVPEKFEDLFWAGAEHIEIGEFSDEKAFKEFINLAIEKNISFGIHSPIYRNGSKYDLLEKVNYEPEFAWEQIAMEADTAKRVGAAYLLVHFPYFKDEIEGNANEEIEEGLRRLKLIKEKYNIEIVCEPKLGLNRSSVGIDYMDNFPREAWARYGIKLCIDIGDYMIATDDKIIEYISKWTDFIRVVHLHNIIYTETKYIWTPVHPSKDNLKIHSIINQLTKSKEVYFIFEHTPETKPSSSFVMEGFNWVSSIIK